MHRVKRLTKIPVGSILAMKGMYNNTADNPNNPRQTVFQQKHDLYPGNVHFAYDLCDI